MSLSELNTFRAQCDIALPILKASYAPRLFEEALGLLNKITEAANQKVMAMCALMVVARFRHKLGSPSFLSQTEANILPSLLTSPYWKELQIEANISDLILAVEAKIKELDAELKKVQADFNLQISSLPEFK